MAIRIISSHTEFESLATRWNELAGEAPFRRWQWAFSAHEAYGDEASLQILEVSDQAGRTIGIAPWRMSRSWRWGRCLEFLGGGEVCGDDLSLLAAPGCEDAVVHAVADWLEQDGDQNRWDWLRLDGVSADNPTIRQLERRLTSGGAAALRRDDVSRWIVELPSTWDEYVGRFGRNARHLARKSWRRLESGCDGAKLKAPQSHADCRQMFDAIVEMHQRRWQSDGARGCFASKQFERHLRAAMLRWYDEGSLWMRLVTVDDAPASGGVCVMLGSTLFVYLVGRDPGCARPDVGWLLSYGLVHEAIENGVAAVDFLRGDEPYKAALGARPKPQVRVEIVGRGSFNRLRYLTAASRETAKRIVRSTCSSRG